MPITIHTTVTEAEVGLRLDVFLAGAIEDATRSFLKKIIKDGDVLLNSHSCTKPSQGVAENDEIVITLPDPARQNRNRNICPWKFCTKMIRL